MQVDKINSFDAAPLMRALTAIADAGRARKASGVDDEAVIYGRIANTALMWREADLAGDLVTAQRMLDDLERMATEVSKQ